MKKNYILFALLLMVAGVQTAFAQRYDMKVWRSGLFEQYMVSSVDSVTYSKLVESIELSPLTLELQVGETAQLNYTVLPKDAGDKSVIWESSSIVSVSKTGLVTANYKGSGFIKCIAADGSGVVSAVCQVTVTKPDGGDPEEHEYVDLGLPSGTLWATCNVGANSPEEFGGYFAWGETSGKDEFTMENYLFYDENVNGNMTKYNDTDGLTELLPEDDAATVNWGEEWRMPSEEQFLELLNADYTTISITKLGGVSGNLVTSLSNGKSIFLPDAGFRLPSGYQNWGAFYWGRTLGDSSTAGCSLYVNDSQVEKLEYRFYGFSVRPVRK